MTTLVTIIVDPLAPGDEDYTSLVTAEAIEQGDITQETGTDEIKDFFVRSDILSSPSHTFAGWTVSADNYVIVRGTGPGNRTTISTSTGNRLALNINIPFTQCRDLNLICNGTTSGDYALGIAANGTDCLVERCEIRSDPLNGSYSLRSQGLRLVARNLLIDNGYGGIQNTTSGDDPVYVNCTVVDPGLGTGITSASGATGATLRNNAMIGSMNPNGNWNWNGGSLTASNNAGESTDTIPGTATQTFTTADFEDYAGGDYRPASGGALDGNGFDLSADFTDDLDGNVRTVPFDIGCYVTAGASGVTLILGTGTESDEALPIAPVVATPPLDLGTATEAEAALPISIQIAGQPVDLILGTATETETALPITFVVDTPPLVLGTATESEEALPISLDPGVDDVELVLGTASEVETALGIVIDPGFVPGGGKNNIFTADLSTRQAFY